MKTLLLSIAIVLGLSSCNNYEKEYARAAVIRDSVITLGVRVEAAQKSADEAIPDNKRGKVDGYYDNAYIVYITEEKGDKAADCLYAYNEGVANLLRLGAEYHDIVESLPPAAQDSMKIAMEMVLDIFEAEKYRQ